MASTYLYDSYSSMTPIDIYIADIENPSERIALEDLRQSLHELLP